MADESLAMPWAAPGLEAPCGGSEAVNLGSDYTPTHPVRYVYVGTTGDVKVDLANLGSGIVFKAVPVGFFPVRATKIYSTVNGTTASNLISCW